MDALETLLEQAQLARNAALAAFNQSRARSDAARAQATQLDTYRADYHRRWSAQFAQGAGLDIVRCYQSFAERLETAIAQQAQAVAQAQAAHTRASDALSACELRMASVRKLIERRAAAQRQASDRREQKADDEQAMRVALARAGLASNGPGARP
jgi:flagellar protein FliJ